MFFKKAKTGQALVETIMVLALYFFIISFTISGFQLMYNKMVFSVAAYEACRETIAYESSKKFAQAGSSGTIDSNLLESYASEQGKVAAEVILKSNALAPSMFKDIRDGKWTDSVKVYGLSHSAYQNGTRPTDTFDPTQHMFCVTVIEEEMDFLFPIISPTLSGAFQDQITVKSSFILAKERIWTS